MKKPNPGLSQKEYDNIAGKVKRRTPLNPSLAGKIKKVATPEQVAKLALIEKQYGSALPWCPAVNILRKIKA